MSELVTDTYGLFLGRGLRGEPVGDDGENLELSVNLTDLGTELVEAMLPYEARPAHVWLPLTTSTAAGPALVWGDDDGLIPTHVPVPPTGLPDRSAGPGEEGG